MRAIRRLRPSATGPMLLLRLALALALTAAAPRLLAWGAEGHRMIGDIASRHLTAAAAQRVADLLKDDRLADGEPSGRRTLGEIANWADELKDTPRGKRSGSWHYDNIPVCGTTDRSTYCKGGNCASAQLERHIAILGNPRATRRHRNEALKWVVHLTGDIHQPLHAANRQDRGGNLVQVAFFGERDNPPYGTLNLHAIWDVHLLRRLVAERGGRETLAAPTLDETERRRLSGGRLSDWVAESHAIAKTIVYSVIPARLSCGGHVDDVIAIDEAYFALAAPVIESQIGKAGLRLARVLNETLGPPPR